MDKENSIDFDLSKIESPIEEFFLNHFCKYLSNEIELILQYPIKTLSGNFRADIYLRSSNRNIIIECDGEEYHTKELNNWYDEWRDTLILFHQEADTIYRINGKNIFNNINSLIYLIYKFEPIFFNSEYSSKLPKKEIINNRIIKCINYSYTNDNDEEVKSTIKVKRKDTKFDFDIFWFKYILYSINFPLKNIKELIDIMIEKKISVDELILLVKQKYPDINIEDINCFKGI